jgi:hypothetical protein
MLGMDKTGMLTRHSRDLGYLTKKIVIILKEHDKWTCSYKDWQLTPGNEPTGAK